MKFRHMFSIHFPQFALSKNSEVCKADPSTVHKGNGTHGIIHASDNFLKAVLTFMKASSGTRTSRAFQSRSDTHASVLFQALLHKAQTHYHNQLSMTNTPRTAPRTRSTTAVGAGGHKRPYDMSSTTRTQQKLRFMRGRPRHHAQKQRHTLRNGGVR